MIMRLFANTFEAIVLRRYESTASSKFVVTRLKFLSPPARSISSASNNDRYLEQSKARCHDNHFRVSVFVSVGGGRKSWYLDPFCSTTTLAFSTRFILLFQPTIAHISFDFWRSGFEVFCFSAFQTLKRRFALFFLAKFLSAPTNKSLFATIFFLYLWNKTEALNIQNME